MSEKEKLRYGLFLGCVIPNRYPMIEASIRSVFEELDTEIIDLPGASCCPAPGVFRSFHLPTWLVIAARNITIAEELGVDIITGCNGCYGTLRDAWEELNHEVELKKMINEHLAKIGREFKGTAKIRHVVDIMYHDIGPEKIKSQVKKSLEGLKLASHYGCHYLKPSEVFDKFEDPEFPRTLDELISVLGAETVEYEDKTHCCGGVILDVDDKIALAMAQKKLDHVNAMGADAMVLMCPLCGSMYDRNQRVIERRFNAAYSLPVLFYPQVLGLALGMDPKGLGLDMNRVKTSDLLSKLGF